MEVIAQMKGSPAMLYDNLRMISFHKLTSLNFQKQIVIAFVCVVSLTPRS